MHRGSRKMGIIIVRRMRASTVFDWGAGLNRLGRDGNMGGFVLAETITGGRWNFTC